MAFPAPNATWRTKPVTSSSSSPFRKQFTQKELEKKRAKNQCFYYDQRYTPRHICSGQVFSLEVLRDDTHEVLDTEIMGNILTNFKEFRMEFKYNGKEVLLRESQQVLENITELHHHYSDVFAIPTTLPPKRSFDHKIWHPPTQKDAIEVMVKELLNTGVIRDSQSSFSVVMELIDELQGSQYFTKLDLRSSYHQIRMHPNDVEKTSFKTHEGHCEFLVTPFGLTNAPSSFQALMNFVFKAYLRRFVLVFFDDILVYSPTLETHVRHLELVLQLLRHNTLYAKQSKCVFKTEKLEYLGHVITRKGVATDKSKIEAMQNWPSSFNSITKKNGFEWTATAQITFDKLKQAIMEALVLKLPNFNELFVIETDASHTGIEAVLQQGGHPVAYSKTLAPRHHTLSTYEKELLAVIQALNKWRGYLLDRHFKIKTDHFSLKYLLEQRITTPSQIKWLPKLMGFDYEILYKKVSDNKAADALSRISTSAQLLTLALSTLSSNYVQLIMDSYKSCRTITSILSPIPKWRPFWCPATIKRITSLCYWKKLRQQVEVFVAVCKVCQTKKPDLSAYHGLLHPLLIPKLGWAEISMDFIKGLPSSNGKTIVFVVVDRLSKYAHFIPLSHPFTTAQSDSQTEVVNRCLECYLRCMSGEKPKAWSKWVSFAEYWYNTTYHTSTKTTSYEVLYGQPPPNPIADIQGQCLVDVVDRTLAAREAMIGYSSSI
nr:hypothetical protein [Tanacetum cinerariifolium]